MNKTEKEIEEIVVAAKEPLTLYQIYSQMTHGFPFWEQRMKKYCQGLVEAKKISQRPDGTYEKLQSQSPDIQKQFSLFE